MTTPLDDITRYLHDHIPLTAAMALRATRWDGRELVIAAPLAPNINHRQTLFGGSAAAAAIVAGWTLVWLRLRERGAEARLVIQRHAIEYARPIEGAFEARCALGAPGGNEAAAYQEIGDPRQSDGEAEWENFFDTLARRGKARLALTITLHPAGERRTGGAPPAATATGDYVAIAARK